PGVHASPAKVAAIPPAEESVAEGPVRQEAGILQRIGWIRLRPRYGRELPRQARGITTRPRLRVAGLSVRCRSRSSLYRGLAPGRRRSDLTGTGARSSIRGPRGARDAAGPL